MDIQMLRLVRHLERELAQYAYISHANQHGLSLNGDFTIQTDFLTYDNTVPQDIVMKWGRTLNQRSYDFSWPLMLGMQVSSDGTFANACGVYQPWMPLNGVRYNLATVYDHVAGAGKFFLNGVQLGAEQAWMQTSIFDGNEAVCVGTYDLGGGTQPTEGLDGCLGNLTVWGRKVGQPEILSNIGKVLTGNEPELRAFWPFNGDFLDRSPYANHLTPVHNPTFETFTIPDPPASLGVLDYHIHIVDGEATITKE